MGMHHTIHIVFINVFWFYNHTNVNAITHVTGMQGNMLHVHIAAHSQLRPNAH